MRLQNDLCFATVSFDSNTRCFGIISNSSLGKIGKCFTEKVISPSFKENTNAAMRRVDSVREWCGEFSGSFKFIDYSCMKDLPDFRLLVVKYLERVFRLRLRYCECNFIFSSLCVKFSRRSSFTGCEMSCMAESLTSKSNRAFVSEYLFRVIRFSTTEEPRSSESMVIMGVYVL